MAFDFSKIDRTVDLKGLQADVEEAKKNSGGDFPTIPAGKYEVRVETLEVKGTKADPNRPMLAVSFKILSGEFKNQRLFMNRVLYGTKNDKNMIASAIGFLEKLDSGVPISFNGYEPFRQLVLDVANMRWIMMIPVSIPSLLMKFLKLRIENQSKIFYNNCRQNVYIKRF